METKNKLLTVSKLFLALAVWFLIYKLTGLFLTPVLSERLPEVLVMIITGMVIPYTISLGAFYLIVRNMETASPRCPEIKPGPLRLGKLFLIQCGLTIPVMIPVNMIYKMSGREMPGMTPEQILAHPVFYVILLLVFAPVMEEFLFRKLILDRLTVLGTTPAIIVSAAFFGLPHLFSQGPAQMLYTFVLGLMLAYVALTSRKLWPCILLHSLSNVYGAFIPTLWPKDDLPSLALYALIYIMIMPLTAVILTVLSRKEIMKVCHCT